MKASVIQKAQQSSLEYLTYRYVYGKALRLNFPLSIDGVTSVAEGKQYPNQPYPM